MRETIWFSAIVLAVAIGCGEEPPAAVEPGADSADTTGGESGADNTGDAELIPNAADVGGGVLSGGQPSPDQLERLAAEGYRTVVSLRTEGEPGSEGERDRVEALGMRFVSVPVDGADGLTVDNARALDEALEGDDARPAVVHCGSGNRAGSMLALRAFLDGATVEEAMELGRRAGMTRLEADTEALLRRLCEEDPDRSC